MHRKPSETPHAAMRTMWISSRRFPTIAVTVGLHDDEEGCTRQRCIGVTWFEPDGEQVDTFLSCASDP